MLEKSKAILYAFSMIGIVDYNAGNITSVARALKRLSIEYVLSKNPQELLSCDRLIFPGVGDAAYAMRELKSSGFDVFLKEKACSGVPILGICLGSQIIFDWSEEGNTDCLSLIKGKIRHFESVKTGMSKDGFKIPHMGWNNLTKKNGGCELLEGLSDSDDFYFVHSYVICPDDDNVIKAYADYGTEVPSVIQSKNIYACQFHPEKSGESGLKILSNFARLRTKEGGLC